MFVIVPDALYNAIQARLDDLFKEFPDAEKDREHLYKQLLAYFHEYGTIPEFTLQKKP